MKIFAISKNKFAIGKPGKRAQYVVSNYGGKVAGVRGVRPILDGRYKTATPSKAVATALRAAV